MATREDFRLMGRIANRAAALVPAIAGDQAGFLMDLEHVNDQVPIDLFRLLYADNLNFVHDVAGIYKHFDRELRELTGCFVPRYAKREVA